MRFFRAWSQQCEDDRNALGQRPSRGLAGPRNPARRGYEEVIDKLTSKGEKTYKRRLDNNGILEVHFKSGRSSHARSRSKGSDTDKGSKGNDFREHF